MLSRVADSLYWINRYLERAENISRFLEVSEAMALDCPPGSAEPWLPLVEVTGDRHHFDTAYPTPKQVVRFLLLDRSNPNSIVSCIAMARENARQIRDVITTEMWEQIKICTGACRTTKTSGGNRCRSNCGSSAAAASSCTGSPTPP